VLPLDAQFKILKGVIENMYGGRVFVTYRQWSTPDDDELRDQVLPLPVVMIDGEVVLRVQALSLQAIIDRLTEMGVKPNPSAADD
jgi:predicted thioredoxin/glutaredoxin